MPDQNQLFDTRPVHPGRILREKLEERGWTQEQLCAITGYGKQAISLIVTEKGGVSAEMARALAAAFGDNPADWVKWDGLFRLSQTEIEVSEIERMARLYEMAPVRDMQKRGWITPVQKVDELETELQTFFGVEPNSEFIFPVALRRSTDAPPKLTPSENAWLFQARRMAKGILVERPFSSQYADAIKRELRKLAAFRKEVEKVSRVLAKYGIRLVIVEPLAGMRIDGAAFWLDTEPVIALSLRYDRIDGFWFTLMHECSHILHGDALSVDAELIDGSTGAVTLFEDECERRANEEAAAILIAPEEMDSFIRRVGPMYSKERVIQFSHKMKIHPGIVVGQLQNRQEIGYTALRDQLVKVRELIINTAFTDGWNQTVAPTVFAR